MREKSLKENSDDVIRRHWLEVQAWVLERYPDTSAQQLKLWCEDCWLYYVGNGRKVGSWPALMVQWAFKELRAKEDKEKTEDRLERQHQDRLEAKGQVRPKGDKWERYRVRNSGKRHPDDPSLH